eukprot:1806448-Rhodomonas_salina.1
MVLEVGLLDKKMLRIHLSVSGLSFASTLFTSRPVTTVLSKPPFQVFILLMSSLTLALAFHQWSLIFEGLTKAASNWKFTILERRSGILTNPDPSGALVMKSGGFALPSMRLQWNRDGTEAVLKLNTVVSNADEWCFSTDAEDPSKDPVRFQLHASNDGETWEQ